VCRTLLRKHKVDKADILRWMSRAQNVKSSKARTRGSLKCNSCARNFMIGFGLVALRLSRTRPPDSRCDGDRANYLVWRGVVYERVGPET
jgi:hypothetical protein